MSLPTCFMLFLRQRASLLIGGDLEGHTWKGHTIMYQTELGLCPHLGLNTVLFRNYHLE